MDSLSKPATRNSRRRPESLDKIKRAARKLFIERGYDAARPQDIAREAGLGHGTFYLHYEDKRACFLAFVDDARAEFYEFMRARVGRCETIGEAIEKTLKAIYDYSDENPGVLAAAMADEWLIDAGGPRSSSLIQQWGHDWAQIIRDGVKEGGIAEVYDADIIGHAIVGAIHQCRLAGDRMRVPRDKVISNLAKFLARALKP